MRLFVNISIALLMAAALGAQDKPKPLAADDQVRLSKLIIQYQMAARREEELRATAAEARIERDSQQKVSQKALADLKRAVEDLQKSHDAPGCNVSDEIQWACAAPAPPVK